MNGFSTTARWVGAAIAFGVSLLPVAGRAVQSALPADVSLTVGYQKVGHLAPMTMVTEPLERLGVKVNLVEFGRYADTRTALLAGSLDIATVGPADLAIALSNGSDTVVGLIDRKSVV